MNYNRSDMLLLFPFSCDSSHTTLSLIKVLITQRKLRLLESRAEAEESTNHDAWKWTRCRCLFFSFCLTPRIKFSHDHKRWRQNRCSASDSVSLIFTRSLTATRNRTPSLVKTNITFTKFTSRSFMVRTAVSSDAYMGQLKAIEPS